MRRWLMMGLIAIVASVLGSAMLLGLSSWGSPWIIAGLLPFVVVWFAGVVVVNIAADHYDPELRTTARDDGTLRSTCYRPGTLRYLVQQHPAIPLLHDAYLDGRLDTAHAEPLASPVALARSATEGPMHHNDIDRSSALVDNITAQHVAAATGVAHRDQILRNLIEHYLTGDRLPSSMPNRFTVAEFHRLFRYVVQEGYGE